MQGYDSVHFGLLERSNRRFEFRLDSARLRLFDFQSSFFHFGDNRKTKCINPFSCFRPDIVIELDI